MKKNFETAEEYVKALRYYFSNPDLFKEEYRKDTLLALYDKQVYQDFHFSDSFLNKYERFFPLNLHLDFFEYYDFFKNYEDISDKKIINTFKHLKSVEEVDKILSVPGAEKFAYLLTSTVNLTENEKRNYNNAIKKSFDAFFYDITGKSKPEYFFKNASLKRLLNVLQKSELKNLVPESYKKLIINRDFIFDIYFFETFIQNQMPDNENIKLLLKRLSDNYHKLNEDIDEYLKILLEYGLKRLNKENFFTIAEWIGLKNILNSYDENIFFMTFSLNGNEMSEEDFEKMYSNNFFLFDRNDKLNHFFRYFLPSKDMFLKYFNKMQPSALFNYFKYETGFSEMIEYKNIFKEGLKKIYPHYPALFLKIKSTLIDMLDEKDISDITGGLKNKNDYISFIFFVKRKKEVNPGYRLPEKYYSVFKKGMEELINHQNFSELTPKIYNFLFDNPILKDETIEDIIFNISDGPRTMFFRFADKLKFSEEFILKNIKHSRFTPYLIFLNRYLSYNAKETVALKHFAVIERSLNKYKTSPEINIPLKNIVYFAKIKLKEILKDENLYEYLQNINSVKKLTVKIPSDESFEIKRKMKEMISREENWIKVIKKEKNVIKKEYKNISDKTAKQLVLNKISEYIENLDEELTKEIPNMLKNKKAENVEKNT